uniref:Leishmanolysin-like peptidase n=1 Tax=Haemonchus contortus TaxID=6289 RepID=A0A7I4YRD7_HAECO
MLFEVVHVVLALEAILACHYVPPKPEQVLFAKTGYPAESRLKREPLWDWIRIKVEYDASVGRLNEERRELLEHLVFAARHYFESTIKVQRLQFLQLKQTCRGKDGKPASRVKTCPGHCEKICFNAIAPQNASYYMADSRSREFLSSSLEEHEINQVFAWNEHRQARTHPCFRVRPASLSILSRSWTSSTMEHDVYMITTPKVREEARRHFNCSTLEGAEVENHGPPEAIFAHWEKRVFEDEMMSGIYTQVAAMSCVTLALFEDSGWYKVNYDKAEDIMWGRNLGCTFATKSCLTWMKSNPTNPYPFCRIYGDKRCSATRLERAECSLVLLGKNQKTPSEYDYNTGDIYQDEKGQPIFARGLLPEDYCPYYMSLNTVATEDGFDSSCAFPGNMNYNNYSLEIFSRTARCFELRGGIEVENEFSTLTKVHTVGCYESICKNNVVMIRTQNSKFYPCYHEGQLIHVEKRLHNVGTVRLQIVCPSCSELCGSQFCAPEKSTEKRIVIRLGLSSSLACSSFQ